MQEIETETEKLNAAERSLTTINFTEKEKMITALQTIYESLATIQSRINQLQGPLYPGRNT